MMLNFYLETFVLIVSLLICREINGSKMTYLMDHDCLQLFNNKHLDPDIQGANNKNIPEAAITQVNASLKVQLSRFNKFDNSDEYFCKIIFRAVRPGFRLLISWMFLNVGSESDGLDWVNIFDYKADFDLSGKLWGSKEDETYSHHRPTDYYYSQSDGIYFLYHGHPYFDNFELILTEFKDIETNDRCETDCCDTSLYTCRGPQFSFCIPTELHCNQENNCGEKQSDEEEDCKIDHCKIREIKLVKPCYHNGQQDPFICYKCRCLPGFSGDFCENIDEDILGMSLIGQYSDAPIGLIAALIAIFLTISVVGISALTLCFLKKHRHRMISNSFISVSFDTNQHVILPVSNIHTLSSFPRSKVENLYVATPIGNNTSLLNALSEDTPFVNNGSNDDGIVTGYPLLSENDIEHEYHSLELGIFGSDHVRYDCELNSSQALIPLNRPVGFLHNSNIAGNSHDICQDSSDYLNENTSVDNNCVEMYNDVEYENCSRKLNECKSHYENLDDITQKSVSEHEQNNKIPQYNDHLSKPQRNDFIESSDEETISFHSHKNFSK